MTRKSYVFIAGALAYAVLSSHGAYAKLASPLTPFTAPSTPVPGNLQTITIDDLKNALADANAQTTALPQCVAGQPDPASGCMPAPYDSTVTAGSDTRHGNCWAVLIQFATAFKANQLLPDHPGLALLQQKIFDAKNMTTKNLIPDYVAHQCVDTFNDANKNLADIITKLGLKAVTLPAIP